MVLRLDSRFATVWRDPFSLQLGVDPARLVLREVTDAEERMISALASGVSRSGLDMIATSAGAGPSEVSGLLRRLKPLLVDDADEVAPAGVSIVGTGPTVDRLAGGLTLAGIRVSVERTVRDGDCDLGIAVGHYVLDPDTYGFWLRRDRPHLAVVFGDEAVTMGPIVEPGRTACLYCLEYYRRDADASWSAIASQLWGRRASSETPLVSAEVSARVERMVLRRLGRRQNQREPDARPSAPAGLARSFRLSVGSGEVTRRDWLPHPDCGCVRVPSGLHEGRPESGSPPDSDPPTTIAVSAVRA
jgi:bacteriocin biosynthesis cyclodehydratase domain-containing protein